jgi:hypothetical protein
MRRVVAVICLLLVASWADAARTPARVCRKACAPLVSSVCPTKGKALRTCRGRLVRECRRQGVAVCAFGLPTGGPGDGGGSPTTTTTVPAVTVTTTTVPGGGATTTTTASSTTTTLTPAGAVAGTWRFEGTLAQPGCSFDDSFVAIVSSLAVSQAGAALSGTVEGAPATGQARADGWTFSTLPDCRPVPGTERSCCLTFSVASAGVTSPSPAEGTAAASCDDGSTCTARWAGSVARSQ